MSTINSRRPKPNVKLAAAAEPLGAGNINIGNRVLCELPQESVQKSGFYCENAVDLINLYPNRFKLIRSKGKSRSV